MSSKPLFPVRHEPPTTGGADDPVPWERFAGRHEGTHYCDVARTPPKPGQSLVRSCQCGSLFRWHDPGWVYMSPAARWRHRKFLAGETDWLFGGEAGGQRSWGGRRYRLRRLLLRLRGWDA